MWCRCALDHAKVWDTMAKVHHKVLYFNQTNLSGVAFCLDTHRNNQAKV